MDRSIAPKIKHSTEFEFVLPPCEHHTCVNGLPIWSVNGGSQEIVYIEWTFQAGVWYQSKHGIASSTAALMKNGTSGRTSYEINNEIEFYGASLKISGGNDHSSIILNSLTKHIPKLLPLVYEIITDAQFPQSELDIYKQNAKQRLLIQEKKADVVANRKIDELLFGANHPYGYYLRIEDLDEIQREDLIAFKNKFYNNKNCKVFIAGKYNDDLMKTFINIFGTKDWNDISPIEQVDHKIICASEKHHRIIVDEKNVQGSIRLARPFIERTHPDYAGMILLNTLFGSYFGSRLMSNIREDKGYTYGIYSYIYNNKYSGAHAIATEAGKDVCEAAIDEVWHEMKVLREELIDREELQLVKNYILGGLLGNLDGPFKIITRWKNLILNDFDEKRFYYLVDIYKKITSEELQALAQKYLHPEEYYNLVVR